MKKYFFKSFILLSFLALSIPITSKPPIDEAKSAPEAFGIGYMQGVSYPWGPIMAMMGLSVYNYG